ncbi:MAG: hypothetical protein Q9224_001167, partial [Gallowayella concinna]
GSEGVDGSENIGSEWGEDEGNVERVGELLDGETLPAIPRNTQRSTLSNISFSFTNPINPKFNVVSAKPVKLTSLDPYRSANAPNTAPNKLGQVMGRNIDPAPVAVQANVRLTKRGRILSMLARSIVCVRQPYMAAMRRGERKRMANLGKWVANQDSFSSSEVE